MPASEIGLPVVRIEASQKAAKGILPDRLAAWIDARRGLAGRMRSAIWETLKALVLILRKLVRPNAGRFLLE
jgi:pyocin activator protein PrtN